MPPETSSVEQAVARTLRDNLDKLQRMAEDLRQAVADLVSACSSSRPTNALPSMLRAQTAAASLAAALEVLSRFVAAAMQPPARPAREEETVRVVGVQPPEPSAPPVRPDPSLPTPMGSAPAAPAVSAPEATFEAEPLEGSISADEPLAAEQEIAAEPIAAFDSSSLKPDEQELHRRANRVAKVSMQDIQMLRPDQVRLGREHKDICVRLRDDIEKAHKEYERRFRSIQDQPVDYFYHWMVEILAGGEPEALGEYPYPTPVLRR